MLQHQITVLDMRCLKRLERKHFHLSVLRKSSKYHFFIYSVTSHRNYKSPFCILVIITETSISFYLFAFHIECFPICLWLQVCLFFHLQEGLCCESWAIPSRVIYTEFGYYGITTCTQYASSCSHCNSPSPLLLGCSC